MGYFYDHTSVLIGSNVYIWGGDSHGLPRVHDSPEKSQLLSSVGVFNVLNATFVKGTTIGTPPNGAMDYGSCCVGNNIYYFGGRCDHVCFHNDLLVLNTTSNNWSQIAFSNGPIKKYGCKMIPIRVNGESYILIIGGRGLLPSYPPSHAQYTPHPYSPSQCYTNEVHMMCVSTTPGEWTVPNKTGSVFPPSRGFSINTLPGNRAIVFGGVAIIEHKKERHYSNDVFIISYINSTVDFQRLDHSATNVQWPDGRCGHSSVVISSVSGNQEKHYLLMLGGVNGQRIIADCWIMEITGGNNQWKQISLPKVVTERSNHSMSCYNMSDRCKWLIVSGGNGIHSPNRLMIVELAIICDQCSVVFSPTNDNWTVTNVLNEEDLKNTTNYTKLVSDHLLERRGRRGGEEQVQLLKQQLKQREQEMISELSLVQRRLEDERRAHNITRQQMNKVIQQKDRELQEKDVVMREEEEQVQLLKQQQKQREQEMVSELSLVQRRLEDERRAHNITRQQMDEIIQQKDRELREKDVVIQQNQEAIQLKDRQLQQNFASVQQKQAEVTSLRDQLENCFWVLQREEVDVSNTAIGDGAYGEVKVAVFRGTRVAAKRLHQLIVSDYNKRVFAREMEISSQIHHPNIVQFIGATRVDNPILLYELMATSLHKQLEIGKPLTRPQVVGIASDICTAMCYLHQWRPQPILHRDISSPNVLMEPLPNDKWRAKLSDFGSANLQIRISNHSVIPGNPAYAAPEALIPQHHTPAMDVYSFGVLLMEMTLHDVPEMDSSMRYRRAQDIDWPAMREIVLQCMNNDRNQRLTSMEILNALQPLQY